MSRRDVQHQLAAAAKHAGVKPEELVPFLRAIPADQVELLDGRRRYSPLQVLEAIKACAAAKKA